MPTPTPACFATALNDSSAERDSDSAAAVAVRSFRSDWAPTLSLSYGAVIGRDQPLGGESGQPSKWIHLDEVWDSVFPEDRERIRSYVRRLAAGQVVEAR